MARCGTRAVGGRGVRALVARRRGRPVAAPVARLRRRRLHPLRDGRAYQARGLAQLVQARARAYVALRRAQRAEIEATDPLLLDPRSSNANTQSRPEGWDQWENAAAHAEDFIPLPEGYYGYQQVDLVIGHGDRPGGHYVHWARERGIDPVAVGGAENAPKRLNTWDQVYQTGIPAELHPSSYVGERAEAHLAEFAESAERFFMFVSFPDPHHPFAQHSLPP